MMDQTETRQGEIVRVVDDSIAYIYVRGQHRTMSFIPAVIDNYRGESFVECGLSAGALVEFESQSGTDVVTRVRVQSQSSDTVREVMRGGDSTLPNRISHASTGPPQCELHPDRPAAGSAAVLRALPTATRTFGKLVDTSILAPGDLMLSRELQPDKISKLIAKVQEDGGYRVNDARWTHAAMYVGDGASLVEATFDSLVGGGDVRLTNLDQYCQGQNVIRFRRSRFIQDRQLGWRVCVRALSRLKKPYDFISAACMWFNVAIRRGGFYEDERQRQISKAVICSTLYADSYNEATRRVLGEVSGVCVPAWLSISDEFDDLQPEWLSIGQ
jgi:hypothetical protein